MRLPVTIVAVALALGCAPATQGLARIQGRGEGRQAAATATVGDADGDRILFWRSAAAALRERGLRIASRGEDRLVTAPRELDVPCSGGTCLARELFVVSVAEGRARVELLRGVWEPAGRHWEMGLAPATAADAVAREAELLRAIVEPLAAARGARPASISLAPR
jgi:hypothetical protein